MEEKDAQRTTFLSKSTVYDWEQAYHKGVQEKKPR